MPKAKKAPAPKQARSIYMSPVIDTALDALAAEDVLDTGERPNRARTVAVLVLAERDRRAMPLMATLLDVARRWTPEERAAAINGVSVGRTGAGRGR